VDLERIYEEFTILLEDFKDALYKNQMPTIEQLRMLGKFEKRHSVLEEILKLKQEIFTLMEEPGNGLLIDAKVFAMELLVEKL
jgi:hypothetical protein